MDKLIRAGAALGILAAGAAGLTALVATKPQTAPRPPSERVFQVETATVTIADLTPEMTIYGSLVAGREVELRALVSGPIVDVGAGLVEGGVVRAGDLLVQIEAFDFEANLAEAEARLAEAEARLREIAARRLSDAEALVRDREMLDIQERELERREALASRGAISESTLDDSRMRRSEIEQRTETREQSLTQSEAAIAQQQAAIERLRVGVARAARDLARTQLTVPFDGFVRNVSAEIGKRVSVNDRIATVVDAGRLEVQAHLSNQQFGRLLADGRPIQGRPAKVMWRIGNSAVEVDARVARVAGAIDETLGGVDVFAVLDGVDLSTPLRPGAFVEIRLADRAYEDVAVLPNVAVHDETTVYVVATDADGVPRLAARRVTVLARLDDRVIVAAAGADALATGDRVVTTRFAGMGPGVRVSMPARAAEKAS